MDSNRDTYAYFWIEGFDCSVEEINTQLGLVATSAHLIGEPLSGGRTWNRNCWKLASPLARGDEFIDSHIEQLLVVLEPRRLAIQEVSKRSMVGINCVGYFKNYSPGFHLSSETIHRIAALGLSVDFDLYCDC